MCCKELHQTLKHKKDLKMETCCKARKRNCRPSLRHRRRGGKRVWKTNAGEIRANNGTRRVGRKHTALNCISSYGNSADLCPHEGRSLIAQVDVNITVENSSSPAFVREENFARETDIESLPFDILVQIICKLRHDELKPLSHVSTKFRAAVVIARQMHFDFSTPVRLRAAKSRVNSMIPNESFENYASTFEGLECLHGSSKTPPTPNAPKQVGKFQKSQFFSEAMKEIPVLLFPSGSPAKDHVATLTNQTRFLRSDGGITNRVLFVEDDLCEAVARNRL